MSDTADGPNEVLPSIEYAAQKVKAAHTCMSAMYSCWADVESFLATGKGTHGDPLKICLEAVSAASEAHEALEAIGKFTDAKPWQITAIELRHSCVPRRLLKSLLERAKHDSQPT